MSNVYVFFADGFEEIEGLTVVDVLRRAGLSVHMVSISGKTEVAGAHGIRILTDGNIDQVQEAAGDLLVLPGGMPGTLALGACPALKEKLQAAGEKGVRVGAICAAPSILGDLGLLQGKKAVCYPGFEERMTGAAVGQEPVVTQEYITTSRGMGTAIDFALELVRLLAGEEKSQSVAQSILYKG